MVMNIISGNNVRKQTRKCKNICNTFLIYNNVLITIHLLTDAAICNFKHPTTSTSPSADIRKRSIVSVKISHTCRPNYWCIILILLPPCSEEKLWVHSDQQPSPPYQQGTWRSSIWYYPRRVHLCLILDICRVDQPCHHSHQPILNAKEQWSQWILRHRKVKYILNQPWANKN